MKPILCLDFDGVIHSYSSGWQGAAVIPDAPVTGAMRFIWDATDHFRVAIYSSRSGQRGGIKAMQRWLNKHFRDAWRAEALKKALEAAEALAELRQHMLDEALFELEAYRAARALAPSIQEADNG